MLVWKITLGNISYLVERNKLEEFILNHMTVHCVIENLEDLRLIHIDDKENKLLKYIKNAFYGFVGSK
jgi:hypothetical protein